jgi:hypothetical protein
MNDSERIRRQAEELLKQSRRLIDRAANELQKSLNWEYILEQRRKERGRTDKDRNNKSKGSSASG